MAGQHFVTHRCVSKPKEVSIRYYIKAFPREYLEGKWILARKDYDWEWMQDYLEYFGEITHCPYCGADLRKEASCQTTG